MKLHLVQEVLVVTIKLAVFSIALHHVNQQLLNGVLQLLLIPAHQLCRAPGHPASQHMWMYVIRIRHLACCIAAESQKPLQPSRNEIQCIETE